MQTTMTGATMTGTAMTAEPHTRRWRWGIRHRVVVAYLALLIGALAVSIVVTRQSLLNRVDTEIDAQLAQEVEELRKLAGGVNPGTGEPFGTDARSIFEYFLARNVPGDHEAFYTFVDGQPLLYSFQAPRGPVDDPAVVAAWAEVREPTTGTFRSSDGTVRFLAVPLLDGTDATNVFVVAFFPDADRDEVLRAVRVATVAGLVVVVLTGMFAWSIAGRALRPVRDLTVTARGISDTDLSGRIPVSGNDELAELGETFNAMIDRLERGFAGQRQFLDDVAHELRTPITIVQGHLELMSDDPGERAETLAIVHDELDRMNRYVNDLLLLAKAETTEFLRPEPVDLGELALSLHQKAQGLGERDWVVDAAPAPGAVAVVADPGRLTQAVLNLAGNAVQHTGPGDTVAIGIEVVGPAGAPTGARLWVRDTGTGLEPGLADRLFDRRVRGAASRANRSDGLGLGLSIVAAIARAHGGSVAAVDDPGGGARFTIDIPAEPPHTSPTPDGTPTPDEERRP